MPNSSALPRGTRLSNGAYAVGEVLGQGGFGITYKGGDLGLRRYVAIKEFFPAGALRQGADVVMADAGALAQGVADFLGEAQVLSRFNHPGIVGVIGTFRENNTAYMVMEWLEGETLEARIAVRGKLDEWEVTDIGLRLASALETVHGAGVLHRDIKPDNVILKKSGGATLIDFGTARAFEGAATKMTQIVTPGYAPLEQYASNAKRGPTADIYALGATLYHALSGRRPVAATDRAADVALPALQSLRPNLTPILSNSIMAALEMESARRPQSAREFEAQLRGQKSPARRPPPIPASARPPLPAAFPAPSATAPSATAPSATAPSATAPSATAPSATAPSATAPSATAPSATAPSATAPSATASVTATAGHDNSDFSELGAILRHATLEKHGSAATALCFAPDGNRLVSAGDDGKLCAWNWRENAATASWNAHVGGALALAYSPDGALLASGGRDQRVQIWDGAGALGAGASPMATLDKCGGVVRDLAFCPVRRELIVADAGAVTLWNADSGAVAARRMGGAVAVCWAPDGSALAVGGVLDGALQMWNGADLSERGRVPAHRGALTGIAWSPDGRWLVTTGADGAVRAWDATRGALVWEQQVGGVPACAAWSPDSEIVAVGKGNGVLMWRAGGTVYRHYPLPKTARFPNRGRIESLAFAPVAQSPYHYVIACAVRDSTLDLCRIRTDPMRP